jgi:hypothetical protein
VADVGADVGSEVVLNDIDRGAVGAGGADRLQRGQSVSGVLAAAVGAPECVVADGVAAVDVDDAVGAAVGSRQTIGPTLLRSAGTCGGPDSQGPELVEGEDSVRETFQHMLDPVELGVALRVGRFLPGPGMTASVRFGTSTA